MGDIELEMLKMKKLAELKKRATAKAPTLEPEDDPWRIVEAKLVDRGREVLYAARTQFPVETEDIVRQIALLISAKRLNEPLGGELLFTLFRNLGIHVRLNTKIVYEEHGKVKTLAEKIKEKR
jgi:DNA-binding TFAR19-related protein (PDSD5 family)